jgi:ligand-binding sensor domain-containing protein/serine phosphatase RsbU (regulator of sigma subunit)
VLSILGFQTQAQLYNFTNYSLDDGLPQSTVFAVHQDSRGYLWVGTESGLARFNGLTFTVFDRSSGLPGNVVRTIINGPDNNLWIGTDNGIAIYNGSSWKTISQHDGLSGTAITKLLLDKNQRVWAATNDGGVNVIRIIDDSVSIQNINRSNGLAADFVLDIMHDSQNRTWLAMIGGINIVEMENDAPSIANFADSVSIPSNLISSIEQDDSGNIWIGTLDVGVFQLIRQKNGYSMVLFDKSKGLTDSRIWDIFCDQSGHVWFGSNEKGLFVWDGGKMQNITTKNGLPGNLILNIFRDNNRNLWLGSMNGLSLFHGFHLVHYSATDGLPGTQVLAVKNDRNNALWVGGDGKGLVNVTVDNNKLIPQNVRISGFKSTQVTTLDCDSYGNLIIGTRGDGIAIMKNTRFYYLTTQNGLTDNNINCVYWNEYGSIYAGTDLGYNEIKTNKIHSINEDDGLINAEVQTVISDLTGNIWMGTMGGLAKFHPLTGNYRDFNAEEGLFDLRIHCLAVDKQNRIYIGTNNGMYRYNEKTDTITPFLATKLMAKTINSLLFFNNTTLIVGTTLGFNKISFDSNLENILNIGVYDKTNGFKYSENNQNAICKDNTNQVWFGTVNGLTRYAPQLEDTINYPPLVHLTGIRLSFEAVNWNNLNQHTAPWTNVPANLALSYFQNHLTFDFDGIFLKNPGKVQFRHRLEPHEKEWSPASSTNSVTYSGLTDDTYSFIVSASADGIHWSTPVVYNFVISPPFWKTIWFFVLCTMAILLLFAAFVRYREQKLKKEKEHLEQVVKERTAEVVAQKDHIQKQHEIVTAQKHEITSSITYARRIQQAVLPGVEILSENTAENFILYKPRDIVSGDFYWVGKNENRLFVAAADCTGHGVPGAFMSMLGISFMNKIIREQKNEQPHVILGEMRKNVITSLKQGNYEGTTKDGMDMALCVINTDTLEMVFSGAYNPAIIISNGEAVEFKANRMPVGLHIVMDDFTPEARQLKPGDCVYLFSDGFQDQIGGPDGRKFMRKNLRELLLSIHTKPFSEQKEHLDQTIEEWRKNPQSGKNDFNQVDDITVVGFRM